MKTKFKKGEKSYAQMPVLIKGIDKENHTLTMVASTQDTDRHGDVVIQSGWDLTMYEKNPVILNSHQYNDATEVIAKATRTEIVGKGKRSRLEQDWKFAVEENPKAKIIFDLYAGGFLNASSVGFIPTKFKQNQDGSTDYWTIEKAELLEVSAVSVPANARALAKAKGIDVEILEEENDEEETEEDTNTEAEIDEEDGTHDLPEDQEEDEEDQEEEEVAGEEDEQTEPEPAPEPPKEASYQEKVLKAVQNIESEQKRALRQAQKAIESMLNDEDIKGLDENTKYKVRRRKLHQTIRNLIKINK